ncbi:DoxX family membrane protein [Pseudoduganella eburnea]|uniref:DoxX family membrane protein n=1 Tax=Massilia eburnea TaxID=1776165 RepID=A0A6L6QBR7_9BURK|nr:DoxX family protein [Massilia eburnea]MTW09464.1 DoxX family membrane protein [Massilia eburnea]
MAPHLPGAARLRTGRANAGWRVLRWLALLLLCAAYLQGGLNKLLDFGSAVGEMQHFGLAPAAPLAAAVILFELGAAAMVLSGRLRWLGAAWLALFTVAASFIANRYWEMAGMERFMAANSFYEHLGLAGGFLLVAWHDLAQKGGLWQWHAEQA